MKPAAQVLFALCCLGLQSAALRWLGGGAVALSLAAPCLVYVALHGGNVDGSVSAAGIGFVLDAVSGTPRGLLTFLGVGLFLLARAAGAAVDVRGRIGFAALSFLGSLVLSVGATLLLRYTAGPELGPGPGLVPRMLLEALLTALVSPLVLEGMRRLDKLFHREEPGLLR